MSKTVRLRHLAVTFLQNISRKAPIAHSWNETTYPYQNINGAAADDLEYIRYILSSYIFQEVSLVHDEIKINLHQWNGVSDAIVSIRCAI